MSLSSSSSVLRPSVKSVSQSATIVAEMIKSVAARERGRRRLPFGVAAREQRERERGCYEDGEREARMGGWMGRVRKPLIKSVEEEEREREGG